jgi:hypothetical protein
MRALAQTPANVPIRTLAPAEARTSRAVRNISGIRQLPDGRVLVNDRFLRQLVVFDQPLATFVITADTAAGAAAAFPMNRGSGLIPYIGDSTLALDDAARAFVVIDGRGQPTRTMAPPIAAHYDAMSSPNPNGFDARGRLFYQAQTMIYMGPPGANPPQADSAAILRADFDRRTFDTVGMVRIQTQPQSSLQTDANGRIIGASTVVNPAGAAVDSWTVTSDGTVAIVRGHDYHVDWIDANGTLGSTPKMPFDWRRLTDAEKQLKIDSARKFIDAARAAGGYTIQSCPVRRDNGDAAGGGGGGGTSGRGGGRGDTSSAGRNANSCYPVSIVTSFVPLAAMPDYIPPVRTNAASADRDGNVWIIPTTSLQAKGGLLYDVVNRRGELFERVQLPPDRAIAGFGPGGVVYLSHGDRTNGIFIERARVIRPAR